MRKWSFLTAICCCVVVTVGPTPRLQAGDGRTKRRPNFVVVLADDLGFGDLGCYGDRVVKTPNLDRLAAQGLRLRHCYAAHPNCSPSRAALLTGRTPYRAGIHNWIPQDSPMHLRADEITIATLLRRAGYTTCHVGKWHLCGTFDPRRQPGPSQHGFDYWFATQNIALPNHRNPDNFYRNGKAVGKLKGYSAPLVVEEAVHWLKEVRPKEKPFFLFVCFHEPHEPIATDPRFAKLYASSGGPLPQQREKEKPGRADFYGNITQLDSAFGRLMQTLDDLKLRDTTLVFFTSDNGPAITAVHPYGSAGPLRDKKGSLYDGGVRVPGIIRWPGRIRPGTVCDEAVSGVDLLPTLCAIAGIPAPKDRAIDGASILPIFEGKPIERQTPLYWQFNRAHSKVKVALRAGDWKILATLTGPELKPSGDISPAEGKIIKNAELDSFELYNLHDDVGEKIDRGQREPKRLAELSTALRKLYREVRDASPVWPAWTWPRTESKRIEWPPYWKQRKKVRTPKRSKGR